ncbi:MAG: hypothetical protein ACREPK_01380, partial [Rhodanobacteraceae bacterium]
GIHAVRSTAESWIPDLAPSVCSSGMTKVFLGHHINGKMTAHYDRLVNIHRLARQSGPDSTLALRSEPDPFL